MKKIFVVSMLIMLPAAVFGQGNNLNPTVQVVNAYQGKLKEADKEREAVFVPDSLYSFDLNFNYSGFENPYKGNAGFNPFFTEMEFRPGGFDGRKLYLKAGAGYTLNPVFDASLALGQTNFFKFGAYASHHSYFGPYRVMRIDDNKLKGTDDWKNGYESSTTAGIDGRFDWENCSLLADIHYDGVHSEGSNFFPGTPVRRNYNAVAAGLKLLSNLNGDESAWKYNVALNYEWGRDRRNVLDEGGNSEHNAVLKALFGFSAGKSIIELDVDMDLSAGMGYIPIGHSSVGSDFSEPYVACVASASPRYVYSRKGLTVSAGVTVMAGAGNEKVDNVIWKGNDRVMSFWPSVNLDWVAVPGKLNVYVDTHAKGGLHGLRESADKEHFFIADTLRAITKSYDALGGIRGTFGFGVFSYDLYAGFEKNDNMPLYLVRDYEGMGPAVTMIHDDICDGVFGLDLSASFSSFTLTGDVSYRLYVDRNDKAVLPPALNASLKVNYSLMRRFNIWLGADYTSSGKNKYCRVPGFVDLYAGADYKLTENFRIFLDARNLLNDNCQYIPLICRKGISVTGGIVLNY